MAASYLRSQIGLDDQLAVGARELRHGLEHLGYVLVSVGDFHGAESLVVDVEEHRVQHVLTDDQAEHLNLTNLGTNAYGGDLKRDAIARCATRRVPDLG